MAIPIIGPLLSLGENLFKGVATIVEGWQQRQTLRAESQARIEEAKATATVTAMLEGRRDAAAWDKSAVDQMSRSWKDEFILLLFSIPMPMAFIPGLVPYVGAGFAVLDNMPDWYKAAWGVMVAASFGYSKYADWIMRKNGGFTGDGELAARIEDIDSRLAALEAAR